MDYGTQHAIDSAVRDCESKIADVRFDLERQMEDLKSEVSRLEERCSSLAEEIRSDDV